MKIYTRTGDDGTTGLLGKARVPKHDARVEAYGSVDELNAVLGLVHAHDTAGLFGERVPALQMQLFDVGAELATTDAGMLAKLTRVGADEVVSLEQEIDRLEKDLEPLTNFVLPGGTGLAAKEPVSGDLVRWLNRLADLLFVMARWANARSGVPDRAWTPRGRT